MSRSTCLVDFKPCAFGDHQCKGAEVCEVESALAAANAPASKAERHIAKAVSVVRRKLAEGAARLSTWNAIRTGSYYKIGDHDLARRIGDRGSGPAVVRTTPIGSVLLA